MNIALVHMRHAGTGGTERYLNHLAAYLAASGHQVTIVCRRHEAAPHPGVRFVVLRSLTLGSAHRMLAFARTVERHVSQAQYDVVFGLGKTWSHDVVRMGGGCHQTYLDLVQTSAWSRFSRRFGFKTRLTLAIEARALTSNASKRVITNSHMVKQDVVQRYELPAEAITVIHNGVDLERFHPRHRYTVGAALRQACDLRPEHTVLLFLGTGYRRKGLDRLLEVFPGLRQKRPEVRLLVVGYDSDRAQWQAHAARLGLHDTVCFLGGRRDAEACYAAADLYVLPTRYDPFANTTLEALASGIPVLTTDANGGSEVMTHDVHGAILPSGAEPDIWLRELVHWTEPTRLAQATTFVRAQAERHSVAHELEASTAVLLQVAADKKRHAA